MTRHTAELAPAHQHIIRRPRLTRLLDETSASIILLVAPAGYGKTTLAREWVEGRDAEAAWYAATPSAHDVARFASGLAAALARVSPGVEKRLEARLRGTRNPAEDVETLAELLAEDVEAAGAPGLLVIDDYHYAISPESDGFLQAFMSRSSLRILAASRRRPSWAKPRRILYGEVAEVGSDALRLTRDEAESILQARNVPPAPELLALADGWPAVVGLIALSGGLDVSEGEAAGPLYDYIAEELFQLASADTQVDLCRIAISCAPTLALLERLAGNRAGSVENEAGRLGLWRVAANGRIELHPLFHTFLRGKLKSLPAEIRTATARAALAFHVERREWDEALEIALSFTPAEAAAETFGEALDDLLSSGRVASVARVAKLLGTRVSHPTVDLAEAELAFRHGEYRRADALAQRAASAFGGDHALASHAHRLAGDVALFQDDRKSSLLEYATARDKAKNERDARQALWGIVLSEETADRDRALRAIADFEASGRSSDPEHAIRLAQARMMVAIRGGGMDGALVDADRAAHLFLQAVDPYTRTAFRGTFTTLLILTASYDAALEAAAKDLKDAVALKLGFARTYALAHAAAAHVGQRRFAAAARALREAERDIAAAEDKQARMNNAAIRARLAFGQAQPGRAAAAVAAPPYENVADGTVAEYLALRAVALASTGDVDGSAQVAGEVEGASSSAEATVLLRAARAISRLQQGAEHARQLEGLLEEVERTNNRDSFVTAFRAYPPLISAVAASPMHLSVLEDALRRGNDVHLAKMFGVALDEAGADYGLTTREEQVLGLLAQGLTNREIASVFVLSETTVKVHVRNILRKLGVRSRTEAALRAAEEGVLSSSGDGGFTSLERHGER